MTSETNSSPVETTFRRLVKIIGLVCLISVACWFMFSGADVPEGVGEKNYKLAAIRFESRFKRRPDHFDTLMMAGELAVKKADSQTAIAAFVSVPDDHPEHGPSARFQEALVLVSQQRAPESERSFRKFLRLAKTKKDAPSLDVIDARRWLSFLLSVQLRIDERKIVLADAHAAEQVNVADSKQYYFPRLLIWKSSTGRRRLMEFLQQDQTNFLLNVAYGRYLTGEGKLEESRKLLESLSTQVPNQQDVIVALLECYFEQNNWERFAKIVKAQPDYRIGERHVLTRSRGELALHESRWEDATVEFSRALESDLADPAANMGLVKALNQLNRVEEQRAAQHRSLVLSQIRVNMARIDEKSFGPLLKLAEQCREIDMPLAAETFEWHSRRVKRQSKRDRDSQ